MRSPAVLLNSSCMASNFFLLIKQLDLSTLSVPMSRISHGNQGWFGSLILDHDHSRILNSTTSNTERRNLSSSLRIFQTPQEWWGSFFGPRAVAYLRRSPHHSPRRSPSSPSTPTPPPPQRTSVSLRNRRRRDRGPCPAACLALRTRNGRPKLCFIQFVK